MQLKKLYWLSLALVSLLLSFPSQAQDSTNYKLRKQIVVGGNAVAYTSTMVGLYQLWYKDYPLGKFHWFNDNAEWNQMDKVGHVYSCYYEGVAGIEMMKWAGYTDKQAAWIGGAYGFFVQSGVEVFDGLSEGWGASWGDVASNTVGSGLAISQSLLWDEQRIWMKYSNSASRYAQIRPHVLGSNYAERVMKDYNAQTYWLSTNIKSFVPESKWPAWLNMAVGYGADGMVGGHSNIFESDGVSYDYTHIVRARQFYLSPDIDLTKIKTDKAWLKTVFVITNCLKFPMPGLEYHSNEGFKGHWILF
jgi:uncharacterized protein YfiM (DUF2279 family)